MLYFGEKVILKNTSATINRGDKIALIGANGKGKSTLLRVISGTEQIEGERRTGHNVIESFFAQHQLESLNVENTLIDELKAKGHEVNLLPAWGHGSSSQLLEVLPQGTFAIGSDPRSEGHAAGI